MKLTIFSTLFLIFLVLKLTGSIAWSWWWITAPLWGGFLLGCSFYLLAALIAYWVEKNETPHQRIARRCREMSDALSRQ